jgi:hypothetical protein
MFEVSEKCVEAKTLGVFAWLNQFRELLMFLLEWPTF